MALTTTTTWRSAVQAQFRRAGHLRVSLNVSPPGLREGASVEASSTYSNTSADATVDGDTADISPVVSLEPDRWRGDGSMYLMGLAGENKALGWWSRYPQTPNETLTYTFNAEYDIPSITVLWDTETNSWPTKFTITGYNAGNVLTNTYTQRATAARETYKTPFTGTKKIVLTMDAWSVPGWRARVAEVIFGVYLDLDNDRIQTATMTSTASLLSSELPKAELAITFNNYDKLLDPMLVEGYSRYLAERQRLDVVWGLDVAYKQSEHLNSYPMFLSSWSIPADDPVVQLTATSRLTFLTGLYTKGTLPTQKRSLKVMVEEVLNSSDLLKLSDDEVPWELDPVLDTLYSRAPVPVIAANAAVQLIANAAGCMLDVDISNNNVRIRSATDEAPYTITQSQQLGDPAYELSTALKSIDINLYTYRTTYEEQSVYTYEDYLAGSHVIEATFNDIITSPRIEVSGATVTSTVFYARSAVITLVAPAEGDDISLEIFGKPVDVYSSTIRTYQNTDLKSGLELVVDNELITEMATLKALSNKLYSYYTRRKTLTMPYLGYPELETGDKIAVTTQYGSGNTDIVSAQLEYNGAFTGTLKLSVREDTDVSST